MNKCSIIEQIQKAEENIRICYDKVADLERRLKFRDLPVEQKRNIEKELQEVRKLLATNEEHLSQLHGKNRQTFAVAAALSFGAFLIYGVYCMFVGYSL